jgi:hypothetical protein
MAGQDPQMDQAMIQQIAAQQLGGQAPQQEAPPQDPRTDPKADNPPTTAETATAKVSPKTEGDKAQEDAFIEVDYGNGRKETMSSSQIAGMSGRYKDLNHKNATVYKPLEPAINLMQQIVENARANGQEVNGDELANFVSAAIQGYQSNPTMGGQRDRTPDSPGGYDQLDESFEREIAQWENENAVSVPPMYRNAAKMMNQLTAENHQMKSVVQQLLQQAGQMNQESRQQLEQSQGNTDNAYRQQAANNLNTAQQQFGLPDDAENDFFDFAFGRGYSVEDFIDPQLTQRVMQDFSNNRSGPEMERLRSLNQRRQAFTGSVNATPSMGGAPQQGNAEDAFMQQMASKAMAKRSGMGR